MRTRLIQYDVGRGDPPRRAIYPLCRIAGMAAAGGIYAAPTNQTIKFITTYGRGRGMPRPYGVVNLSAEP